MIKLEGCVERELELLTMLSSLWPQGGTPGPLGCPESWGRGCGWTSELPKLSPLFFCKAPAYGCCPPVSFLGPTSLTQFPVDLLRLNRAHGLVSPFYSSLPTLISLCPSFLGRKGKARG